MELYNLRHSPFLDFQSPFTAWEAIKMAMLLPLVPIRVALILLTIGFIAVINTLATLGWPEDRPLSLTRRRAVEYGSQLCIIILACMGFHVKVTGWGNIEAAKKLRTVGIFNHVSYIDTLLLFWLFLPSGVSKQSNSKIPLVGNCIKCLNNIYVDETTRARDKHSSQALDTESVATATASIAAQQAEHLLSAYDDPIPAYSPTHSAGMPPSSGDQTQTPFSGSKMQTPSLGLTIPSSVSKAIAARVHDRLYLAPGGYPMLFIAPEGTVTNGQCLLKFRTGAFTIGQPVLPVLLQYPFKRLNPAYCEMATGFHVLRLMCQWLNQVEITVLPPYVPGPEEVADATLFASNVRRLMANQLGVPLVEQEYAHCSALRKKGIWMSWNGRDLVGPRNEFDQDLNIKLEVATQRAS